MYSAALLRQLIPESCDAQNTTNQQCIAALNEFVSLSSENALTVSQLENDILSTFLVTGLKQGVQAAIDSSDPASFTSRQANNEQPTLLLAAVGDCGDGHVMSALITFQTVSFPTQLQTT